jgi:hypothetical protein
MAGIEKYLKLNDEEKEKLHQSFLKEPDAFYEKAETDQLLRALNMTHKERFLVMTRLMKMGAMLKRAKIVSRSDISNK